MTGSAFIIHNGGWCCSNAVNLDLYNEPLMGPNGQLQGIKQYQTLMVDGPFNTLPVLDADCDFVFKPEDVQTAVAFKGRVKALQPNLVIVVSSPIKDHKYIIDSVKNNIGI